MASLLPKPSQVFGKPKPKSVSPPPVSQVFGAPAAPGSTAGAPQGQAADKGGTTTSVPAPVPASPPVAGQGFTPGTASWQDSTYNQAAGPGGTIQTGLNNFQAYLTNQGKALGLNYGVNYTGDPTSGTAGNFTIDPNVDVSNPFSKAALLKRSFDQATTGNTNSYAAQGQLYSGALQNAQNQAGFQNQQGQDALFKDFAGQFAGLYQQWLSAQQNATGQVIDAQGAAILRHENDVPPAAAAAAGAPVTAQGTPAPPPPPGVDLKPGMIYLPNDGVTKAQYVNPDGTVRPATAEDKGGTTAPAPAPRSAAQDKGGTAK